MTTNFLDLFADAQPMICYYFTDIFFLGLFPIWGRRIVFSFSMFSVRVLLLSVLPSLSCLCLTYVHFSFGLCIFHLPCSHYYNFLSSCPNYLNLASLIFPLMFATPALGLMSSALIFSILFISIIHLSIMISVFPRKSCSAFLDAQVSLPIHPAYTRTGLMTVLYTATCPMQFLT